MTVEELCKKDIMYLLKMMSEYEKDAYYDGKYAARKEVGKKLKERNYDHEKIVELTGLELIEVEGLEVKEIKKLLHERLKTAPKERKEKE